MNTDENARFDWTDKELPINMESPLDVTFDPPSGTLVVRSRQAHAAVRGGIQFAVRFDPEATAQLAAALRQIETTLGAPIESPTKGTNVQ